jgi:hypothetical protein
MSDTPEADAAKWIEAAYNSYVVSASIAKKLEIERNVARTLACLYRDQFYKYTMPNTIPPPYSWEESYEG